MIDFEKNKEKGNDSKDFAKKLIAFASSLIRGSIGLFLRLQCFRPQAHLQVLGAARRFRENSSNIKRGSYYRIKLLSLIKLSTHTSMFYEAQE
ncbi:hypothetical protein PVK06_006859 [Gossypium arboreum]|uniref:Uncharacterized protein n=1 Tax=Gossypium arboreum TaxID=29729 RepID=A0ABR0QGT0_GOSAR|nr:hypothetical protein PVK06_006859 [Gossypium arboreum]